MKKNNNPKVTEHNILQNECSQSLQMSHKDREVWAGNEEGSLTYVRDAENVGRNGREYGREKKMLSSVMAVNRE